MAKQAAQTMEMTQATQMLQWLEEERRKDKSSLSKLEERGKAQAQQLAEQAALIQDLQTTLAGMKRLIARTGEIDDMASVYKEQISQMLDQREEAWRKEQAEATRARKLEVDRLNERLDQLDKDLVPVRRLDADKKDRQAEQKRLNEALQQVEAALDDAHRRSDDRAQAVTYLEEQRRSDNRRIAELEQETTDLRKKIEAQASELLLMNDTINKQKTQMDEGMQQIKAAQKFADEVRAEEFRREQKFLKFSEQMGQLEQEMDEWRTQNQRFAEQYQENKRALEKLEGFQSRLERRQNEVAEMQRLAEDRFKRQWEEWQAALAKELKRYELVAEEQQRIQEKRNQEYDGDLKQLWERMDLHRATLEALLDIRRAEMNRLMETGRAAIESIDHALAKEKDLRHRKRR
jgi:chromosome segregation ATPase